MIRNAKFISDASTIMGPVARVISNIQLLRSSETTSYDSGPATRKLSESVRETVLLEIYIIVTFH